MVEKSDTTKTAFITGASKRIGATIASFLHRKGMRVILHYNRNDADAKQLQTTLNQKRAHSAYILQCDFSDTTDSWSHVAPTMDQFGSLDILVNNASCFTPTPLVSATEKQWDEIFNINLKAPYFLTKILRPYLKLAQGSIINITDIYAQRPLFEHAIYCASKAGLLSLTKSLAQELAPEIRVNAIAPGAILWPETDTDIDPERRQKIIDSTPLKRVGCAEDIAKTVFFLANDAPFISGQTITVDGGKTIFS